MYREVIIMIKIQRAIFQHKSWSREKEIIMKIIWKLEEIKIKFKKIGRFEKAICISHLHDIKLENINTLNSWFFFSSFICIRFVCRVWFYFLRIIILFFFLGAKRSCKSTNKISPHQFTMRKEIWLIPFPPPWKFSVLFV